MEDVPPQAVISRFPQAGGIRIKGATGGISDHNAGAEAWKPLFQ